MGLNCTLLYVAISNSFSFHPSVSFHEQGILFYFIASHHSSSQRFVLTLRSYFVINIRKGKPIENSSLLEFYSLLPGCVYHFLFHCSSCAPNGTTVIALELSDSL